ncbi:MAG: hypothetical protein PF636_03125 [Actinomycetota bacterium]|jgi:hypothetical protein|nr:hypothetical protein [Actinomycetota bacterium]
MTTIIAMIVYSTVAAGYIAMLFLTERSADHWVRGITPVPRDHSMRITVAPRVGLTLTSVEYLNTDVANDDSSAVA